MNLIVVIFLFKIEGHLCLKEVAIQDIELQMINKILALKYKKKLLNLWNKYLIVLWKE